MENNKESNPFTFGLSENAITKLKHSQSMKLNLNKKLNPEFIRKKNEINNKNNNNKPKRVFIARKLDSKEIELNNFCRKGIKEIFNNENLYFSDKYCNNTVKIGNGDKKLIIPNPIINIEKKKFVRKKTTNLLLLRNLSKSKTSWRDSQKSKLDDSNNNNMSLLSKYDYKRPSMSNSGLIKRPSISFKDKENISDKELKMYFQNLKNKIKEKNKSRNYQNYFVMNNKRNTYENKSVSNEIKNRLLLQEKILNEFKTYNMNNNNMIKKLKKFTKKNKDNLLINQINNFREQKYNNYNTFKKQNTEHHLKIIEWLSSLRQYGNNKKDISLEKKEQMHTYSNNFNNIKKEEILDNYINKLHYSFGSNCTLYSDIQSPLNPICALIIPENLKNKEITKYSYYNEKNKNKTKKNYLPVIVGKSLLDYEIELTKELEGKKKLFIRRNYPEDDIKPLTFANSNKIEKTKIPKAITNTLYLHYNK